MSIIDSIAPTGGSWTHFYGPQRSCNYELYNIIVFTLYFTFL